MREPSAARYRAARKRLLIDMHIPDWDSGFLARYEPQTAFAAAREAGADALMIYFQNHLGQCFYPTQCGTRHAGMQNRDYAGELVDLARAGGMATAAYYSVNFNNQAWIEHPDWRLHPAAPAVIGPLPRERYGIVCLNHPEQRRFVMAQLREILAYPVDVLFCDMMWWNGICVCDACAERHHRETGTAIPRVVDWADPAWTGFQQARRRWLAEWSGELVALCAQLRPEIDCYHNFALGLANWTRATSIDLCQTAAFLGGDFYGSANEQLLMTRFMQMASRARPPEYMTTLTRGLTDHTPLRGVAEVRRKALAAVHADQAFLAILAVDPDGALDPEAVALCKQAFAAMPPSDTSEDLEPYAAVAVYFSDNSRANLFDPPLPLDQAPAGSIPDYPHYRALAGAAAKLQRGHVPFAVITRLQLDRLSDWPVIMLCNAQALTLPELAALRGYVEAGGRLFCSAASGCQADGTWPLGDWLGLAPIHDPQGAIHYVAPPGRRPLAHRRSADGPWGIQRFSAQADHSVLARLTLPYGYPSAGTVMGADFASIHSSPPWHDTDEPAVVRIPIGQGEVVYCGVDLEAGTTSDHQALLLELVSSLLPEGELALDAHPDVWMSVYRRAGGLRVMLLHYAASDPALPVDPPVLRLGRLGRAARAEVVGRDGTECVRLALQADGEEISLPSFRESLVIDIDLE